MRFCGSGPLTDGAPGRSRTCDPRLRRPSFSDGESALWSACGQLLHFAATGESVPVSLIVQIAAASLLEWPEEAQRAQVALAGGADSLAAAIGLAGKLLSCRPTVA